VGASIRAITSLKKIRFLLPNFCFPFSAFCIAAHKKNPSFSAGADEFAFQNT
jgi:hypothetical protein